MIVAGKRSRSIRSIGSYTLEEWLGSTLIQLKPIANRTFPVLPYLGEPDLPSLSA
ncbi:hypothetical protein [Aerosakkonema funiforme]|uniref:hypothetical protein n=1 Tax=Aerosakkonema funiforme TaxID=1246630 RepID=UPI0035BBE13A